MGQGITVTIMAPRGRDGALLAQAAREADVQAYVQREAVDLREGFARGEIDCIVLTQEALDPGVISAISRHGERAAAWDQLPVLLLVDGRRNTAGNLAALREVLPDAQVSLMQRPVRMNDLLSAVQMLVHSRERQYEVRDLLVRETELRRELNHRVKNILSTVQALYTLSARTARDQEAFDASFQGRMSAMARVHEILFASSYDQTDADSLLRAVLQPYEAEAGLLNIEGGTAEIDAEIAQDIALCVHELATNAAKYGGLEKEEGHVEVRWGMEDNAFVLDWREGGARGITAPERKGFGLTFIRAALGNLGGRADMEFHPDGLAARLEVPLRSAS